MGTSRQNNVDDAPLGSMPRQSALTVCLLYNMKNRHQQKAERSPRKRLALPLLRRRMAGIGISSNRRHPASSSFVERTVSMARWSAPSLLRTLLLSSALAVAG